MGRRHSGWQRVVLGEVVDVMTDYWDRNAEIPERFVAGEHIDEGDLRVRRWGMTSDELVPPTFNRRFHAGDVLFHSRNLKKLACPDFSGITGEKLFVLRVKNPARLLPSLLPFLLQTHTFREYVNRMWAGSTNKFLNKAPLVRYEFALPPLEEQRRIATAATAIIETLDATMNLLSAARTQANALAAHTMLSAPKSEMKPLSSCASRVGVGIASSATHAYREKGVPMIRNTDIRPGVIDTSELLFLADDFDEENASKRVRTGDVVVARTGVPGTAAVVPSTLDSAQTFTTLIVTPDPVTLDSEFLAAWINGPVSRSFIRSRKGGGVQQNMNATLLESLPTWCPPLSQQRAVVELLYQVNECVARVTTRLEDGRIAHQAMLERMLAFTQRD